MTPTSDASRGRPSGLAVAAIALAIGVGWLPPAAAGEDVRLTPVVRGTPAGEGAEVVLLCPDLGLRPEVFMGRGQSGLALKLAQSGYRVYLADPWHTAAASSDGFDGVVAEVWPAWMAQVKEIAGGAPVTFIGHGVCGALPVAAAAAPRGTAVPLRWVAMGTPFDWRLPSPAWLAWLQAWGQSERPLPAATKRAWLTGLRPGLGGRASSLPSNLPQEGDMAETLFQHVDKSLHREPPLAVVKDVLRWYATGSMTSGQGWVDYTSGMDGVAGPALLIAGMSDTVAPPEDVLVGVERMDGRIEVAYRLLSRANGHNEEYGHLGMLLSRHAAWDVDRVVLAWLRGWKRLP